LARVVVLGTGTAVGKTYVSCALIRALRGHGASAIGLKPVETGVRGNDSKFHTTDAQLLERAAELAIRAPHPAWSFEEAVSPHLAAKRARQVLEPAAIAQWVHQIEFDMTPHVTSHRATSWCVIETAGGVLSPLSGSASNFDLAQALSPAIWVLVAPDALGVLHEVRATLLAMAVLGRKPDYVVLSAARASDASTGTNARELEDLGITRVTETLADGQSMLTVLAAALVTSISNSRR
jgi:dethiobiotin synthetase